MDCGEACEDEDVAPQTADSFLCRGDFFILCKKVELLEDVQFLVRHAGVIMPSNPEEITGLSVESRMLSLQNDMTDARQRCNITAARGPVDYCPLGNMRAFHFHQYHTSTTPPPKNSACGAFRLNQKVFFFHINHFAGVWTVCSRP